MFNLQTQQLDYLGRGGNSESARKFHKLNFAPRVGLAYRFDEKTVIRAGYGLIWQEQAGITTPFTAPFFPFVQNVTRRSLDNRNAAFLLASGTNGIAPVARTTSNLGDPTVSLAQTLRPFPCFGTVSLYRNNVGNTNYHALQTKIEQRFSNNFSFLVAYTRSKLIDEASSVFDATIQT